ncbi:MAG: 3-dehydroquinate dehydratase [Bacteroidia bacterium]|nr:MAG: 3-dehydroquinate dehydratase [Bacteroidia bacterium]
MNLLIINGPNLNRLGKREPEYYGDTPFEDYFLHLQEQFPEIELEYFQSNSEGKLIDCLHAADGKYTGIILNAGAYTHTSLALADAVATLSTVLVEVHISNIFAREKIRRKSFVAPYCKGTVTGFGLDSYRLAILSFLQ